MKVRKSLIYVVNDKDVTLQLLFTLLENNGYQVVASKSGLELLELLEKKKPDLVLLDVNMPEMDGITFCRKITNQQKFRDLTVIFLTADNNSKQKLSGFAAGCSDYITKPYYPEEVVARIDKIVSQKNTKKELEESEKKWHKLFSNLPDNVITVNKIGTILFCQDPSNDPEKSPKNLFDTIPDKNRLKFETAFKKCLDTGKEVNVEFMDDSGKWYMSRFVTFENTNNDLEVMITRTDITKHKQSELMMKENIAIKNNFISNVSNELRTPMSSILGFASTISRDKNMDNEIREEFIKIIFNESKRLSRLIENILDISKIESESYKIVREKINFDPLVQEVIETFKDKARQNQISLKYNNESEDPEIDAAPDELKEVVLNLIDNALKFTDSGGDVNINLKTVEGSLNFSVQDNGIGIPPDETNKIFDKFYVLENDKTDSPGTGLGLAIVKEFVNQHNGNIEVVSQLGKGSTFTVKLPLNR